MPLSQDLLRPFFATPCYNTGIDAVELLAKQIMLDVQNLMNTPLREGRYLLQSLHVAFTQGLAIIPRLMNMTVPINRIPPELLSDIFALSPGTISRLEWPAHWPFEEIDVSHLHKLPKVCRYWRDLALATPTLWTTVSTHNFEATNGYQKSWFRRSAYLPDDSSVGLVVHCAKVGVLVPKHCRDKMTEFMVTNAPKFRELHVWSTSAIPDFSLFLRSFDASTLEHCTLRNDGGWHERQPSPETSVLPLFCKGGSRLRSLSLGGIEALPFNAFPVLTRLCIIVRRPVPVVNWDVSDLVKFLAGSPRLEGVQVYNLEVSPSPRRSPGPKTSTALPHLQYLAFTYYGGSKNDKLDPACTDPVEYLLSHVSIPSTCHMLFSMHDAGSRNCVINRAILDSVRRHVDGKNGVSHVFSDLSSRGCSMQLVFCEGSLHLETSYVTHASAAEHFADLFHPCPELTARTTDVRILRDMETKDHVSLLATPGSLHAMFPNITTVVLIRDCEFEWGVFDDVPKGLVTACQGFDRAVVPRGPQSDGGLDANADRRSIPWPDLDTLWTSVQTWGEIVNLEAMLVARTALGCPIRRVIVTVCYKSSQEGTEGIAARLRALSAEEVILMQVNVRSRSEFRAIDWMVALPERFSLPSTIRRDWPTMWCLSE